MARRPWAGALTWLVLQGHKGLLLVFLLGWMWVLPGWLQPAQAQAMAQGWVSWVMDGDTVLLVPEGGGQALKWRLQDIDAPERCQSGGEASRDALIGLVHRQTVRYAVRAEDSYGRQIGRLERDGLDVGAEMVRAGWAWAWRHRTGRGPYAALQREAQQARRGLFAAPETAMSPAVFRQFHGSCQEPAEAQVPVQRAVPQTGQPGSR